MSNNDTIKKTVTVAFLLCIVCSVIVSTAAVMLKPAQEANKARDFKKNILQAAGLYEPGKKIDDLFGPIETKIVDLETGEFTEAVDPESYEQVAAAKDPKFSEVLSAEEDIAGLARREKYAEVYLVKGDSGLETVILPIRGYGLWGTLYGFIALEADLNTVVGLGYYEHIETPGLGAEVDNPLWKQIWKGKKVFDENGEPALTVIKGAVTEQTKDAEHKVDGLSGATLTARGVANMMAFWFSDRGYGKFLQNLKNGEA